MSIQNRPPEFYTFKGSSIFYDQEQNELDDLIIPLTKRIDGWASTKTFEALDLPSMHANLVILLAILNGCGAGFNIPLEKLRFWAQKMDEPFTIEDRWNFAPWSEEKKRLWRGTCQQTIQELEVLIKSQTA